MTTLTWFTPAQRPAYFKPFEFDCFCAIADRHLLYIRPTVNGRFALSVQHKFGGLAYAKHYVSLRGAQTAAQRWLDKQHEAVRV